VTYPTILKLLAPCVGDVDGLDPSLAAHPESAMVRASMSEMGRIMFAKVFLLLAALEESSAARLFREAIWLAVCGELERLR
jgi:hypothetical protein